MVRIGYFSIRVVGATSGTGTPFPEYVHDGKTYAQVPEGEEYVVVIEKPRREHIGGKLKLRAADGHLLGPIFDLFATKWYFRIGKDIPTNQVRYINVEEIDSTEEL
eukprot:scaffold1922_cov114-Amphora_coffeaeformis.AAC.1